MHNFFLSILIKNITTRNFKLRLKYVVHFTSLKLQNFAKSKSLLQGLSVKICLVGYILVSLGLFHSSTSLVQYTRYSIVVLVYPSNFYPLKLRHELDKLERILSKNPYPQKKIYKYIRKFLKNMFIQKSQIATVPKKERIQAKCLKLLKLGKLRL